MPEQFLVKFPARIEFLRVAKIDCLGRFGRRFCVHFDDAISLYEIRWQPFFADGSGLQPTKRVARYDDIRGAVKGDPCFNVVPFLALIVRRTFDLAADVAGSKSCYL